MKKSLFKAASPAVICIASLASCGHTEKGWSVSGRIDGLSDTVKVALETYNRGEWMPVDSLAVKSDGSFSYTSATAAPYPEIMRLTVDGSSIYFPIDSIDHITVTASAADMSAYSLDGSTAAKAMASIDSLLNVNLRAKGIAVITDRELKHELFRIAYADTSVIPMYYLVNKSLDGYQLFSLANQADVRYWSAVAQRFSQVRPDDPRTDFLARAVTRARALNNGSETVAQIEVPETGLFDIVRYDARGNRVSLADAASQGKIVVLSFTDYDMEKSPAYNAVLNQIWEAHHDAGLEIFQLDFEANESTWKLRAANLPWTSVWNSDSDGSDVLLQYNVGVIPMTYIIDRDGTIAARVLEPADLPDAVKKYF